MGNCPKCDGKGSYTLLYSHNRCSACKGTGRIGEPDKAPEAPVATAPTYPLTTNTTSGTTHFSFLNTGATGADVGFGVTGGTYTITSGASGGSIVLYGGDSTGSGSGGSITITAGSGTIGGMSTVDWAVARLKEYATTESPSWLVSYPIPVVAPVSPATLADAMMLLEQDGHEPDVILFSCRDFADTLKWDQSPHVRWEGREGSLYGVRFQRSREIPVGTVAVVSKDRRMTLLSICR